MNVLFAIANNFALIIYLLFVIKEFDLQKKLYLFLQKRLISYFSVILPACMIDSIIFYFVIVWF